MKKILAAFYPSVTPVHIITFSVQLAKENSAAIRAVYLSEDKEPVNSNYPFPNDLSIAEDFSSKENIAENSNKIIEDNIKVFKDECELSGISFSIEKNISVEQLIKKTADSDLLVIDSETNSPEEMLRKIDCPAFITSTNKPPEKVILMCDNSVSSRMAIEAYISLFPEYIRLPTYVVTINPKPEDEKEIKTYLKEELQPDFPDLVFQRLDGKVKNELRNFLDQLSVPVLVVMGAFSRSSLSESFHPSLGRTALKGEQGSLFIANKNKFDRLVWMRTLTIE